jgi:hypothetical protein
MSGIYKIILCFLLLFCTTAHAQDEIDFDFDLKIKYPKYEDRPFVENFSHNWSHVPGATKIRLIGVHDTVISYIVRRFRRLARDQVYEYYDEFDGMNRLSERQRDLEEINSTYNPRGDWWSRSWLHSMPPEKGGAPKAVQIHSIGWEISIPKNFPILYFFKRQWDKIGDIWLDDERAYINIKNRSVGAEEAAAVPYNEELQEPINVVLESDHAWYKGINYHLRFRPAIRVRPGRTWHEIFQEFSLKMAIELYTDKKVHFGDLIFSYEYNTELNNHLGNVMFVLLIW